MMTSPVRASAPRLFSALVLLLALASCGGDDDKQSERKPPAPTSLTVERMKAAKQAADQTAVSAGESTDDQSQPADVQDRIYADADRAGGLTAEELAAEPPSQDPLPQPVSLADAKRPLRLEIFSERGYEDAKGRTILDLLEKDYLYLTLLVEDAKGRPVQGARPVVTPNRDSRFVSMAGEDNTTDAAGSYPFGLVGGTMGEERVYIAVDSASQSIWLNVISLRAAGYGSLSDIKGALDWNELTQAKIQWGEQISATFPESIRAKNGETVKLAGFMMPLEMKEKQSHFVLTSNPPSCFFHVPGGPAGTVEVFADKPVEVDWDPLILEGRFETLETSEVGVLYRLHDARVVKE